MKDPVADAIPPDAGIDNRGETVNESGGASTDNPFGPALVTPLTAAAVEQLPTPGRHSRGSDYCAVLSPVFGGISLGMTYFASRATFPGLFIVGAVAPGLIGLGIGVAGLCSRHRGLAIAGIVFSCIGGFVGSFQMLIEIYSAMTVVHPFLPAPSEIPTEAPLEFLK